MEKDEYRHGGDDAFEAWCEWKDRCPDENHAVIPFAAGWNAAMRFVQGKINEEVKKKENNESDIGKSGI